MANLSNLIAKIPAAGVTRTQGIMVAVGAGLGVNVWGSIIPARYIDPLVVNAGDTVVVDLMYGPTGQAEAVVSGKLTAAPRPGTGTVKTVPPASPTITVTGTNGVDYTAKFLSTYTPTVGDNVMLSWGAAVPYALAQVGGTAPTPIAPPVSPPPGPSITGTSTYPATDSGTYETGYGWEAWAGGGGHLYQGGSAYGATGNTGSWFYSGSPTELAGRTITRVQFRLSSRRNVGAYNSPVTVHFYAHTSPTRPGGDVARTAGPYDVTIQPGAGPQTIDLPTSFGAVLQAGGGISISGESYAGFLGRLSQPDSGLLTIDWTR